MLVLGLGSSVAPGLGMVESARRLLSSSSVDNSWTTGVEVDGTRTGRRLVFVPCWFLAWRRVCVLRTVLAEAGGTMVSVVTSSNLKLRWGVFVVGSVVSFCFLSWDVAISFTRSLGCGQGLLSGCDFCSLGVGCTAGSGVGSGSVVSGTGSVLLLGLASSTMRTGDLRSIRYLGPLN